MDKLFDQSEVWWNEGWNCWATQCDCIAFDRHQNGKIYRHTGIDILKMTTGGTSTIVTLVESGH